MTPDTWLDADLLHFIICLGKHLNEPVIDQECSVTTSQFCVPSEVRRVNASEGFSLASVFELTLYATGCVNGQMEQCARVGKTERILGISLVFGSTLPFSSPNSLYSSARTIHCSYCRNEPKEMGDQLRQQPHRKMFWYNDSPRHQNVFTKCLICFFKASVPQQDSCAQLVPNHREKQTDWKRKKKCSIVLLKWLLPEPPPPHCSLSLESLMGWFKQTVNGWILIICVPLIMSH